MDILEDMLEEGFAVELQTADYWVISTPQGQNILYDPVQNYVIPFIEQQEYYGKEKN